MVAGAYFLTRKGSASPATEYTYRIYNEGNLTNALNLKTNQIDFQDANSGSQIKDH